MSNAAIPQRLAPSRRLAARRVPGLPRFRRNLWLLLGACLMAFVAMGVQTLVLNLYLLSLGYREDYLGLFSLANTAGIGLAALAAGRVSNRYGPRRTLMGAIAVLAISSAALVASVDPIVLLGLSALNGASLAHIFVPCATYVMDNALPDERSTAYAGYFAAQSVAMVIGSILGGVFPTLLVASSEATRDGYVLTLLAAAALAAVGVVPLRFADDARAEGSQASLVPAASRVDARRQMRRDMFWLITSNALVAGSTGFVIPFLNVFLSKHLSADTAEIGVVFALGSAAMVVASVVGPGAGRRFGVVATIVGCRAITAPVLLAFAVAPSVPAAAALYVVRTLFTNLTWPVDNAFTMELVSPNLRATLAALRSASWNIAWALTSGLGGLMIVAQGFSSIFVAGAVLMWAGCLIYFLAFRAREIRPGQRSKDVAPATPRAEL